MKSNNFSIYYSKRFTNVDRRRKNVMWKALCAVFLQKYINGTDTVMDLGAGYCEFINNIKCKRKIAVDVNPDTKKKADKDITVLNVPYSKIPDKYNNLVDVVFISNFLEHLDNRIEIVEVLKKANRLLRSNGRIIIIQPNIDLVKEKYWNFIDHKTVLNTESVKEALAISGFKIDLLIRKFLPYTTKALKFYMPLFIIKIYLLLPQFLRPFAGQSFVVATKK